MATKSPEECEDIFDGFQDYMDKLIHRALPVTNADFDPENPQEGFNKVKDSLPIIKFSDPKVAPCSFQVLVINQSEHTGGAGRFLCDILSRWLIPGKQMYLSVCYSVDFYFEHFPDKLFFVYAIMAHIKTDQDLQTIKEHRPHLEFELSTILRSVIFARRIISSDIIDIDHKRAFIEENLLSLLDRPKKEFDQTAFDAMHQFFIRISAEYNFSTIREQFAKYAKKAPRQFDRDIFNEIQHYVLLIRDAFMSTRTRYHLYRLISYKYLFRKSIAYAAKENPHRRYMPVKILPIRKSGLLNRLGFVIGLNTMDENEIFEARHILAAVNGYVKNIELVKDSFIVDARKDATVRTFYVEIKKINEEPFSGKEVSLLREKLPKELPSRIESITHSLFVHRNEEEVMRNILILARQLKFVKDIPQVIVNFDKQTPKSLCFTVILLRLLHTETKDLKTLLQKRKKSFTFYDYDVKIVGHLRKKLPKEANVFEIRIDKHLYLRDDHSIDLHKARQAVVSELNALVGDVRDFNGGMISKQNEALDKLRARLKTDGITNDFVLENFFYSTIPAYMQSVIPTAQLQKLFSMIVAIAEKGLKKSYYSLDKQINDSYCLIAIGASQDSFKETLELPVEKLKIPGSELCTSTVRIYDLSCVGYLYRFPDQESAEKLIETVESSMKTWEESHEKPLDLLTQTLLDRSST